MVVNCEMEVDNMTHISQSEQKRLQSLKEKKQQFRLKEQQIRLALNNLDNKPSSKKIVFDKDFGEDTKGETNIETKRKRKALFENNDEEEDDEADFVIDINKSTKNKKLQQSLGNDKRFTLDSRFLEDEQEQTECKDDTGITEEDCPDPQKEKEWQLNILGNVLGAPIAEREQKDPKLLKKAKMIRYDPTALNHEEYEVKNEKPEQTAKDKKKKKNRELDGIQKEPETEPVPVSKDTFYSVSDTLKESLKQEGGFSLLKTYGKEEEHDNHNVAEQPKYDMLEGKQKHKFNFDTSNPFKYDSTDDENDEENDVEMNDYLKETSKVHFTGTSDNFFFAEKDTRFNEAVEFFKNVPSTESDFKNLRRELKQIVRAKIRNNTKKNTSKRVKKIKSNKIKKFKKR